MDDLREAWERDGYVVLRAAAPTALIAAYAQELTTAHDGLLVRGPGDEHVSLAVRAPDDRPTGAVDPYALSPAARGLLLASPVTDFLTNNAFAGDAPLLFDAVEASAGAPDPDSPFRDATFTAPATEPETLVTATVALADGATVTLFPGSQRIPTTPFSGRYRHFNPERDGDAALQRHHDELSAALGEDPASDTITLSPGDAVLWSADLVHTAITGTALVAHLCPARVQPSWFTYRPERARHAAHEDGAAWIATQHYDLVDAVTPDTAPPPPEEPELTRVEEALREHDEENPPETPTMLPSRRSGLVNSVRGLMRRRGR